MSVSVIDDTVGTLRWAASVRGRFSRQPRIAVPEELEVVFNAWGQPVGYTVSQAANNIDFTQTETIQYDALGRPLGEFQSGTFPGEAAAIQTQHTLSYNAITGRMISDTNAITTSGTAPEGTDPARYVYAPNGTLLLREMGTFGATTPNQYIYALTDPTGTVIAIASAAGTVDERYVFDGLGNAQALQANGTPYDVATFSNPNRSANWQFQQQFSGSTFNTGTQLLTYAGTDYAWNIVYQGNLYDGMPGVYETADGVFNPREQSLLAPDLQAIQQGLGADGYNPGRGVLSYLWSEASSAWNSIYESTPFYGAGQALTDIGNGISGLSSWANNEINSAPAWLQPALTPYQVEFGAFNSVGNMIGGMGSLLENPISTAANVIMHPIDVAEAAWGGVTGTFSNLFSGNPYQMGQAVGNIAMAVAPFAGEFGDVARVGEVGGEVAPRTISLNVLNPISQPDSAAWFQGITNLAVRQITEDPAVMEDLLSETELTAAANRIGSAYTAFGKAVHGQVQGLIERNELLQQYFQYVGNAGSAGSVDVLGVGPFDGLQFDVIRGTPAAEALHYAKYGETIFGRYNRPPVVVFP